MALRAPRVGFLLCVPLAYASFARRSRDSARAAAATIGLNPVAIWCAAEGHNDALALAIMLLRIPLVRRRTVHSAPPSSPSRRSSSRRPAAADRARESSTVGARSARARRSRGRVVFSVAAVRRDRNTLAPHGAYAPQASLQAIVAPVSPHSRIGCAAVASARFWRRAELVLLRRSTRRGLVWFGLGSWVLVPNPYPWYGLWLVALAALGPRRARPPFASALATSLLRYVPDAVGLRRLQPLSVALGVASRPSALRTGSTPSLL